MCHVDEIANILPVTTAGSGVGKEKNVMCQRCPAQRYGGGTGPLNPNHHDETQSRSSLSNTAIIKTDSGQQLQPIHHGYKQSPNMLFNDALLSKKKCE
jgi:hypothetical protein